MNCLEALKLARDTGCKVRPKEHQWLTYFYRDDELCVQYSTDDSMDGYAEKLQKVSENKLLNPDGSEVQWERVQEEREAA